MILDEGAVRKLLRMEDLIPAMADALADLSGGKVVQPMRVMVPVAEHSRSLRRVSAGLRLFGARPADTLEPAGPMPGRLAKSLDYPSRKEFLENYRCRTTRVRALYDRVVRR